MLKSMLLSEIPRAQRVGCVVRLARESNGKPDTVVKCGPIGPHGEDFPGRHGYASRDVMEAVWLSSNIRGVSTWSWAQDYIVLEQGGELDC